MSIRILKYCDPSAGGGGTGDSGDPWTLAEAVSNASSSNVILVRPGTYPLSADVAIAGNNQLWVGVDGSDNPVGWWNESTLPVFDFQSTAYTVFLGAYTGNVFWGLRVINSAANGFTTSAAEPNIFINCVADDCGSSYSGFSITNYGRALFCKASGSGKGFYLAGIAPLAYKCVAIDNTIENFSCTSRAMLLDSVSVDTGSNTTNLIATTSSKACIVGNSVHGSGAAGTYGINNAGTGPSVILNNLIDAVETGIVTGANAFLANNSVYGATTAYSLGTDNYEISDVTTDPQFTDPEALDFSIGEAAFKGHFSTLSINLGADQAGSGGGGSGAGSIFGSLIQVRG